MFQTQFMCVHIWLRNNAVLVCLSSFVNSVASLCWLHYSALCAAVYGSAQASCLRRYPPGQEIYRKDCISVFEVDGEKHKVFTHAHTRTNTHTHTYADTDTRAHTHTHTHGHTHTQTHTQGTCLLFPPLLCLPGAVAAVLPEPLSAGQALPGPQDTLL